MAVDPETVTLMSTYRIGFLAPAPNSLAAGELYIEMAPPEGGAPRVWVGTMQDPNFPGGIASLVPPGVELPPPLPATAPTNTAVPYVSPEGTASPGDALNCTMGEWEAMEGDQATYEYDWQRDAASIGALAGADYTVTPADAGCTLTCVVTATNLRGSTAAPPSNPVAIAAARAAKTEESEPRSKRHKD